MEIKSFHTQNFSYTGGVKKYPLRIFQSQCTRKYSTWWDQQISMMAHLLNGHLTHPIWRSVISWRIGVTEVEDRIGFNHLFLISPPLLS